MKNKKRNKVSDKNSIEIACGIFHNGDKKSWSEELIKERVKDLKREEKPN